MTHFCPRRHKREQEKIHKFPYVLSHISEEYLSIYQPFELPQPHIKAKLYIVINKVVL